MALATVQTAMTSETGKSLHPFFTKTPNNNAPYQPTPDVATLGISSDGGHEGPKHEVDAQKGPKKRGRKSGTAKVKKTSSISKDQSLMDHFSHPSTVPEKNTSLSKPKDLFHETTLEEDPNIDRRKRQKTSSPVPSHTGTIVPVSHTNEPLDWQQQLQAEAMKEIELPSQDGDPLRKPEMSGTTPGISTIERCNLIQPITPPNSTIGETRCVPSEDSMAVLPEPKAVPTKKIIKISKNGKLLSSPPSTELKAASPKRRRGRKPAEKSAPSITILKYGQDIDSRRVIGMKIEAIIAGSKIKSQREPPKKPAPKLSDPSKPTHPFFLGKAVQKNEGPVTNASRPEAQPLAQRNRKQSTVTPGKLRFGNYNFPSYEHIPAFGPAGGSRAPKQAGLNEAPWPRKDTIHVRNLDSFYPPATSQLSRSLFKARKMKSNAISITKDEDLILKLGTQLLPLLTRQDTPLLSDFKLPEDIRLPSRLLMTGAGIQSELRKQIGSLSQQAPRTKKTHPAVDSIFSSVEHHLTAFDLGRCESLSWVQKYAPQSVSDVLQTGTEAMVLKDWLENLAVLAVEKQKGSSTPSVPEVKKPPRKKRKKVADDFIVDSDEEDEEEEMIEISNGGSEDQDATQSTFRSLRRPRWTRNKTVILISGPHGCGKSAMVNAVARDLGFEIFEINSGARRSGKDIQEKVGDMAENHLVSGKQKDLTPRLEAAPSEDTDIERHSDALKRDLESGRQGTMMSFFKTSGSKAARRNTVTKSAVSSEAPTSHQTNLSIAQSQLQPPRKSQKQSLILLEEADVLFEEDQQFWPQVTKLAAQSKRPIIITCTNEALVPWDELPLAAILRLSPPPTDLATDYMLAIAGHEGHILDREAVSTLFQSRNHDLRASITELNFWCQMSVGDRKGGLEWIYQRWPPGKDVDKDGHIIRVVSKGTYEEGMGFVPHNIFASSDNVGYDREEELLKELWAQWGINPYIWTSAENVGYIRPVPGQGTLEDLKHLDAVADTLSAMDRCCCLDLPSYSHHSQQPLNPSLPPISDKARLNHTVAAPVIQVDYASDFTGFDTSMLTQTNLLVQRCSNRLPRHGVEKELPLSGSEQRLAQALNGLKENDRSRLLLSRSDFSQACDVLAYLPDSVPASNTSYSLTASSFDRTFNIVVEELAPYVRSIVLHEIMLENERIRLGNLLSEGGRTSKRQRTTRAARTALEGGMRETKRRERWFDKSLNRSLVMRTAGVSWAGMGSQTGEAETESRTHESQNSAHDDGEI